MTATFRRLLSAGAAAFALATALPAQAETYTPADSGSMSENFTSVPTGDESWYVLYCVDVGTLAVGDILVVAAESQVQKPTASSNIEFATQVSRTSTSCGAINSSTNFLFPGGVGVTGTGGFNITPTEYRGVAPKAATEPIMNHPEDHYVTYNVQASDILDVVLGGGRLQVLKIHQ